MRNREGHRVVVSGDQDVYRFEDLLRQVPESPKPVDMHPGDIGFLDEEGYFHIADRKKDMIIVSGYNVCPADAEAVLFTHPKLKEAAVIGVPDEKRGETVKAFVVLKEGMSAAEEEIISFCRDHPAAYKIPRIVAFREDLPKSLIGKVLRRKLREETEAEKVTAP